MKKWTTLAGKAAGPKALVYGGDESWKREDVEVIPWRNVSHLANRI